MTEPQPDENAGSPPSRSQYMRAYRAQYKRTRKRISLVLAPEEWRRLDAAAKSEGRRPQALAKSVITAHLEGRRQLHPDAARRLDEAVSLIRYASNNLNQIAHRLNEDDLNNAPAPDARAARETLGAIFEGLQAVRERVAALAAASGAAPAPGKPAP